MSTDRIIERIRKMLALAQSSNVHEAATAAARASEMLREHKLSMAEVEAAAGEDVEPVCAVDSDDIDTRRVSWKGTLAAGLAEANGCVALTARTWSDGKCKVVRRFIGRRSDADAVAYLFRFFVAEIERLCDERGAGKGAAFRNAFRHGAAHEIGKMLHERAAAFRASSEKALTIIDRDAAAVDAWIKDAYGKVGKHAGRGAVDAAGVMAGRSAARDIGIPGNDGKALGAAPRQIGSVRS